MHQAEFLAASPGELVQITGGVAFMPDALPRQIDIDWGLGGRLYAATSALSTLDGQASLIQNKVLITRPPVTRAATKRARIDGTHALIASVLSQAGGEAPMTR